MSVTSSMTIPLGSNSIEDSNSLMELCRLYIHNEDRRVTVPSIEWIILSAGDHYQPSESEINARFAIADLYDVTSNHYLLRIKTQLMKMVEVNRMAKVEQPISVERSSESIKIGDHRVSVLSPQHGRSVVVSNDTVIFTSYNTIIVEPKLSDYMAEKLTERLSNIEPLTNDYTFRVLKELIEPEAKTVKAEAKPVEPEPVELIPDDQLIHLLLGMYLVKGSDGAVITKISGCQYYVGHLNSRCSCLYMSWGFRRLPRSESHNREGTDALLKLARQNVVSNRRMINLVKESVSHPEHFSLPTMRVEIIPDGQPIVGTTFPLQYKMNLVVSHVLDCNDPANEMIARITSNTESSLDELKREVSEYLSI